MRGSIKTAAHDAGDFADSESKQNSCDNPTEGKTTERGQNEQCNDKSGTAGFSVAVRALFAHVSVSLPEYHQKLYHMKHVK